MGGPRMDRGPRKGSCPPSRLPFPLCPVEMPTQAFQGPDGIRAEGHFSFFSPYLATGGDSTLTPQVPPALLPGLPPRGLCEGLGRGAGKYLPPAWWARAPGPRHP